MKKNRFFLFTQHLLQIPFFDGFLVNFRRPPEFFDQSTSRTSQNASQTVSWAWMTFHTPHTTLKRCQRLSDALRYPQTP